MEKSKYFIILCCICCFAFTAFAKKTKGKIAKTEISYVEEKPKDLGRPIRVLDEKYKLTIIEDAKSAATVAFVYASSFLGKKHAEQDQPYSVQLLNDSIWVVKGANHGMGHFIMNINKFTGQQTNYMHGK